MVRVERSKTLAENRVHFSLPSQDAALVRACAASRFDSEHVHLRPLGRYGNSGSRLFAARFDERGNGADHVLKLTPRVKALKEWAGLPAILQFFPDAVLGNFEVEAAPDLGATLYKLFAQRPGEIVELRDYIVKDAISTRRVTHVLNKTYERMAAAHRSVPRPIDYGLDYEWYERGDRLGLVDLAFGDSRRISVFGNDYAHPTQVFGRLKGRTATVPWGFVHGDLHPNNVVMDEHGSPAIIDFAWSREFDITVDFALMECSIRFLLFPQNVDWHAHRSVNVALLEERGPAKVTTMYKHSNSPLAGSYLKMAGAVSTIRRRARDHAGELFNWDHYLVTQFLILYGLSKVASYPFFQTVDALGLLGTRIESR